MNPAPGGAGFLVSVAAVVVALAAPADVRAGDTAGTLEVGAALTRLDYAELDRAGEVLDDEVGWLPGVALRAELESGRLFVVGEGRLEKGPVAYDGRTQSSAPANDDLPITTTTRADFARAEVRGGGWLDAGRRVGLYAGAAARRWGRDIRPTTVVSRSGATIAVSGLEEVYDWKELQAGLRLALEVGGRGRAELDGRLVQVVDPRVTVDWAGELVSLALGARTGWRLGATARIVLPAPWFVTVEVAAERYRFGASGLDSASLLLEPSSETTRVELAARVGARL